MPPRQVLLVEPDAALRAAIAAAIGSKAIVDAQELFETARQRLLAATSQLVVTNLRLHEYNGLHLAYLANVANISTRVVVYGDERDVGVALDVKRACAFFELRSRIVVSVCSYLTSALPPVDRRDPSRFDRRSMPRGGRRLWDRHQQPYA